MLPLCYLQAKLLVTKFLYLFQPQTGSRIGGKYQLVQLKFAPRASNWVCLDSLAIHEPTNHYSAARFDVALWQCCGSRLKLVSMTVEKGRP